MSEAIVLLSGGLDSAVVLACAKRDGHEVRALSFWYGQRHAVEVKCAKAIAKKMHVVEHLSLGLPLNVMGGSSLTDHDQEIPKGGVGTGIPTTYVPGRNIIFLAFAASFAEIVGAEAIYLGVNAVDYSGYPDCRPEFIDAFREVISVGTRVGRELGDGLDINAPLISMRKAEIVKLGLELGVDFSLTSSCYDPTDDGACGECDSCRIRLAAFKEVGFADPIRYREVVRG